VGLIEAGRSEREAARQKIEEKGYIKAAWEEQFAAIKGLGGGSPSPTPPPPPSTPATSKAKSAKSGETLAPCPDARCLETAGGAMEPWTLRKGVSPSVAADQLQTVLRRVGASKIRLKGSATAPRVTATFGAGALSFASDDVEFLLVGSRCDFRAQASGGDAKASVRRNRERLLEIRRRLGYYGWNSWSF